MRLVAPVVLSIACTGMLPVDGGTAEPELTKHVEELRQAELALQAVDDFLPCSTEAAAKTSSTTVARTWDGEDCFARIGWEPKEAVRGGYFVTVNADRSDFVVVGLADTDGDGTFMRVEASRGAAAAVKSPAEVR